MVNSTEIDVCDMASEAMSKSGIWGETGSQRPHLVSPKPFTLDKDQLDILNRLGPTLASFYTAINNLYLSNKEAWVNGYLDIGKSDDLKRHALMKYHKRTIPHIMRPDILLTPNGFVITELDSVPGGFGHLECLTSAYKEAGFEVIGSGIIKAFTDMLKSFSGKDDPVCVIEVSDESIDYLPEMRYFSSEISKLGYKCLALKPNEITFKEDGIFADFSGEELRIDVLYRFFELFDLANIPKSELISYAARKKLVKITPAYKHFLEEKIMLALLHSSMLSSYFEECMGDDFSFLKSIIAPTWVLDNTPVPPHAHIAGFSWKGGVIRDWMEIINGTQKERRLVIKPSGFSELAWGSRGVKIGHDMSQLDWAEAVKNALNQFNFSPNVIQQFHECSIVGIEYYHPMEKTVASMAGRVRLCPYYFNNKAGVELAAVMATVCPKDKKIIHGMADAVIMPCNSG